MINIMLRMVFLLMVTATAVNIINSFINNLNYVIMKKFKVIRNLRVKNVVIDDEYVNIHVAQEVVPAFFPNEEKKERKLSVIHMKLESFLHDLRENSILLDLALLKFKNEEVFIYLKKAKVADTIYAFEKGDDLYNPRFKKNEDYDYPKVDSEKFYSHVLTDIELNTESVGVLSMMLK